MLKFALTCSIIALALTEAACGNMGKDTSAPKTDPSIYYAVLLTNGAVYFGQLEGLGTAYPVLRDVYYVQSNVNQETKAVTNALVKRGKEWHSPDRMILNEKAIVLIEPVGKDSLVAQRIKESKQ